VRGAGWAHGGFEGQADLAKSFASGNCDAFHPIGHKPGIGTFCPVHRRNACVVDATLVIYDGFFLDMELRRFGK
jgi:hypothetical protein